MDNLLLIFTVVAGLSGWGAIAAWWLRERVKSIRALKETRRRNDRLQRAIIYTLSKWREQVEQLRIFHAIEHEYAERLSRQSGVSVQGVRSTIRAAVESRYDVRDNPEAGTAEAAERQIESIRQVRVYVESGKGTLADLEITDEIRRAA